VTTEVPLRFGVISQKTNNWNKKIKTSQRVARFLINPKDPGTSVNIETDGMREVAYEVASRKMEGRNPGWDNRVEITPN